MPRPKELHSRFARPPAPSNLLHGNLEGRPATRFQRYAAHFAPNRVFRPEALAGNPSFAKALRTFDAHARAAMRIRRPSFFANAGANTAFSDLLNLLTCSGGPGGPRIKGRRATSLPLAGKPAYWLRFRRPVAEAERSPGLWFIFSRGSLLHKAGQTVAFRLSRCARPCNSIFGNGNDLLKLLLSPELEVRARGGALPEALAPGTAHGPNAPVSSEAVNRAASPGRQAAGRAFSRILRKRPFQKQRSVEIDLKKERSG